ncbi:MAG: MoaD/ThiS family protein [Deltaproteobacteria bacterium]|nr:MoaD/ThiS family protein [Deltaproteobacteria bacterium]
MADNRVSANGQTSIITVHLKFFKHAFPQKETFRLPAGSRLCDLLRLVEPKYFEFKETQPSRSDLPLSLMSRKDLLFVLNGRFVTDAERSDILLKDGDVFSVFPVMAGG